ncbi:hypothetical protein SAMN04490243_2263 [Robiginitalea myxolifaciens]|uniref:Uncharacterized protein n=1 Tax=Robiginitalea myxolifaciens TaxID=400055 RepID=A0A1I6H4X2_9FLAO|nr:hypothetical protein SAMN04490243_2263 [Robiginitalea myxolifaciens]
MIKLCKTLTPGLRAKSGYEKMEGDAIIRNFAEINYGTKKSCSRVIRWR